MSEKRVILTGANQNPILENKDIRSMEGDDIPFESLIMSFRRRI